ncbi:unnamed protein product [Parajaminaea phylloscopi]
MAPKTTPPRVGAVGSVPPGGNSKVATPPIIQFDDDVDHARKNKLVKTRQAKARAQQKGGFFSWLWSLGLRIGFVYLLVGAFWTCSSSPLRFDYKTNDSRAHCRALAQAKLQLRPIAQPYVDAAYAKVQPYTKPYVDAASPYARTAWKTARPYYRYANKQGQLAYKRHIEPARKLALKRGRAYLDPHLNTAQTHYDKQVRPHVDSAQRAIKPWQDVYRRDVAPYLSEAYVQSLAFGSASYGAYVNQIHPVVVRSLRQLHVFYSNHVDPAVRRTYALYVRPQVNKALAKVFGHRAHALGSEALRNATAEARESRKQAKEVKKEKVAEAASASRAQEDPSVADRLNKAKDYVVGGPLAAADPVASAASDAELEVETASTKEQLEAWEKGLAQLIEKEYALVVERLAEIRSRLADNLPERFDVTTEDVEVEVEGIFARLAKSFDKLSKSSRSADEKVAAGEESVQKQRAKLERSRAKTIKVVASFYDELQAEEYGAQRASVGEVDRYLVEAQKAYQNILADAKFAKTRKDWAEWDNGMGIRGKLFDEELSGLRDGSKKVAKGVVAIDAGREGEIQRQINKLQKQVEGLYETALTELDVYAKTQLAKLRVEEVAADAASPLAAAKEGAQNLAAQAQALAADATDAVKGNTPSGTSASVKSRASSASASVSSLASKGGKVAPQGAVGDFVDAAQEGFAGIAEKLEKTGQIAFREGSKLAGVRPTPETAGEYVEVAAGAVGDAAAAATNIASSALRQATRSAASVVGASVQPETPGEYIEAAREGLASVADSLSSAGAEAVKSAQQAVRPASDGSYASSVKSAVHSATRSAASVVGVSQTPESVEEYLEAAGDYVKSAGGVASEAAASVVEGVASAAHSATRSLSSVAGLQPSPETAGEYVEAAGEYFQSMVKSGSDALDGAGSAAHSATRSLSSIAGLKPTPETAGEYLEAAGDSVASAASAISSAAADGVSGVVSGSVASSASSAFSSASSVASSVYNEQASGVASVASQASKSAVRAVGGTPEPEGAVEHIASIVDQAKTGLASAAEAIQPSSASSSVRTRKATDEL